VDNYLFDTRGLGLCRKDSFGSLVEIFELVFFLLEGGGKKKKEKKKKEKKKRVFS